MSTHQWARRRLILDNGRSMTLGRLIPASDPPAYTDVVLVGFPAPLVPATDQRGRVETRTIGVQMLGDEKIEVLNDEMAAADWPVPPRRNDRVLLDGATRTVQSGVPVYDGPLLIGWTLVVKS